MDLVATMKKIGQADCTRCMFLYVIQSGYLDEDYELVLNFVYNPF